MMARKLKDEGVVRDVNEVKSSDENGYVGELDE
jgi:hypothetical protein